MGIDNHSQSIEQNRECEFEGLYHGIAEIVKSEKALVNKASTKAKLHTKVSYEEEYLASLDGKKDFDPWLNSTENILDFRDIVEHFQKLPNYVSRRQKIASQLNIPGPTLAYNYCRIRDGKIILGHLLNGILLPNGFLPENQELRLYSFDVFEKSGAGIKKDRVTRAILTTYEGKGSAMYAETKVISPEDVGNILGKQPLQKYPEAFRLYAFGR